MNRLITLISIVAILASLGIIGFVVYQNYQPIAAGGAKVAQSVANFFPQAANRILSGTSSPSGTSTPFFSNPFASNNQPSAPVAPLLEKITTNPVAAFSLLNLPGAPDTLVYVEKDSGNIYRLQTYPKATSTAPTTTSPVRISNLTIPAVFDAYFGFNKAKNIQALVRYPDKNRVLQTVSLSIEPNTATSTATTSQPWIVKSLNLSPNIYELSVSPDQQNVFYLEDIGTRAIAYSADFRLQNKKLALVSPFKDWKINWSASSTVYFYPRASADYSASLYSLNLKDLTFRKIVGSVNGLTALASPLPQSLIYANTFGSDFSLFSHNNKTGANTDLYLKTLPEKCVWDAQVPTVYCAIPKQLAIGVYPDDWYLGKTQFNDALWIVYPEIGKTSQLYGFDGAGENFDITSLKADSAHNFYFLDRRTWTLYRLNSSRLFSNY